MEKKPRTYGFTKENAKELGRQGGKVHSRDIEVEKAKKLNAHDVARCLTRLMKMSQQELVELVKRPETTTMELLVAKILEQAIKRGDHTRMSFLLDRTIGKVPIEQKIDMDIDVYSRVMEYLDGSRKESSG